MSLNRSPALALLLLSLSLRVQAAYFVYGHNALTRTRMDPILNPGGIAGHVHLFAGSNAVDSNMDFASLTSADCTTAPMTVDKSAYWFPQMYYKWKNGTYTALDGDGMLTYWFLDRGIDDKAGERPLVIPDDFRMIGGNAARDHYDDTIPSHKAVSFECFGPGYGGRVPTIPSDRECEILRPQVFMQNCWDGVNSYLPNSAHVTYPIGDYENGKCPDGFKKIPSLFMETYIKPRASLGPEYEWYPGCFMFSNGDNLGLSLHADFRNGFPSGLLVDAFDQCKGMMGDFRDCPLLAKYEQTGQAADCLMTGQVVNEPVGLQIPLAKLPGNNPEYNSSKAGNNPKKPDPAYVEASSLVTFDVAQGGACKSQDCRDYIGPRGAPAGGEEPAAETILPTTTASATNAPSTATASSSASGEAYPTTLPSGDSTAVPDAPGAGKPAATESKPSLRSAARGRSRRGGWRGEGEESREKERQRAQAAGL